MTVSIVTPWVDHLELAPDYFAAMEHGQPDAVIVIDNASDPPLDFASIRSEENLGFAGGSNAGLSIAESDIVVFLNNDIAATRTDWLEQLVAAVEPGALAGPRLRWDAHGDVDGVQFPYLDGWCLAGMRDDFRALGGFDDQLVEPAQYSDNILCLRARAAGMVLREAPNVGLFHKVSATSGGARHPGMAAAVEANYARYVEIARECMTVTA